MIGKGLLIVISVRPVGKGTICRELLKNNPQIRISYRPLHENPGPGRRCVNYHFITEDKFRQMIDEHEFFGICGCI